MHMCERLLMDAGISASVYALRACNIFIFKGTLYITYHRKQEYKASGVSRSVYINTQIDVYTVGPWYNKGLLCIYQHVYIYIRKLCGTGWRRVIEFLISSGHCLQKSPTIGSFAKNDPQLKASYESLPLCIHSLRYACICVSDFLTIQALVSVHILRACNMFIFKGALYI